MQNLKMIGQNLFIFHVEIFQFLKSIKNAIKRQREEKSHETKKKPYGIFDRTSMHHFMKIQRYQDFEKSGELKARENLLLFLIRSEVNFNHQLFNTEHSLIGHVCV